MEGAIPSRDRGHPSLVSLGLRSPDGLRVQSLDGLMSHTRPVIQRRANREASLL